MPAGGREDVQDGDRAVVLVHTRGRQLARHDPAEQALAHRREFRTQRRILLPMPQPDVTISVVAGGSPELLADCLASIPAAAARVSVETVVVDNAVGAGLDGVVRGHSEVRWIRSGRRRGFTANHNLALAA